MKNYKQEVRRKIIFGSLGLSLLIGVNLFLFIFQDTFIQKHDLAFSYQWGMAAGLGMVLVAYIIIYSKAYRHEEKLKQLYIKEHDERAAMIRMKSCNSAILISLYCLLIASVISIYFNPTITITLAVVIYALGIIVLSTKFYYSKKY